MRFFFIIAVALVALAVIVETAEAKEWKRRNTRSLIETNKVRNKNYRKNVKKRETVSEDTGEYPSYSTPEANYNKVKPTKGKKATMNVEDYKQKFKKAKNQHKLNQGEQSINNFYDKQSNANVNQEREKNEEIVISESCSSHRNRNSISSETKEERKKKCKPSKPKEEAFNENAETPGLKENSKSQKMKNREKREFKELRNENLPKSSGGTEKTEKVDVSEKKPQKKKKVQETPKVKKEERERKQKLATQDPDSSIANEIDDYDTDVCSRKPTKCGANNYAENI